MVNEESKSGQPHDNNDTTKYILVGILQRGDVVNGRRIYCLEDYLPKIDKPSKPEPKKKKKYFFMSNKIAIFTI